MPLDQEWGSLSDMMGTGGAFCHRQWSGPWGEMVSRRGESPPWGSFRRHPRDQTACCALRTGKLPWSRTLRAGRCNQDRCVGSDQITAIVLRTNTGLHARTVSSSRFMFDWSKRRESQIRARFLRHSAWQDQQSLVRVCHRHGSRQGWPGTNVAVNCHIKQGSRLNYRSSQVY